MDELDRLAYASLSEAILDTLKTGKYTVQQLCKKIGIDDEVKVASTLARMEMEHKIKETGYAKAYESNGSPVILVKFGVATEEDFYNPTCHF